MAKRRKRTKKYSDAKDALSAFGEGQVPPAQQPPQAPPPIEPPPPPEPAPQLPADHQPQAPGVPAERPQQPAPAAQRPAEAPRIPDIPKVPQQPAGPPQAAIPIPPAPARRVVPARRTGRAAAARRAGARRKQPKPLDITSYNYRQTMIPVLLITGVLVLIIAIVVAVKLPADGADDPTRMEMPPHPMLAKSGTKWIVLALFPVGAGLLFGAFMFIMQVSKGPPSEDQAIPRPRRYDRGRQTRRR